MVSPKALVSGHRGECVALYTPALHKGIELTAFSARSASGSSSCLALGISTYRWAV